MTCCRDGGRRVAVHQNDKDSHTGGSDASPGLTTAASKSYHCSSSLVEGPSEQKKMLIKAGGTDWLMDF